MQLDDGNTQRISVHCAGPASAMGRTAEVKLQTRLDLGHTDRLEHGGTWARRVTYGWLTVVLGFTQCGVVLMLWCSAPSAHIHMLSRSLLPVAPHHKLYSKPLLDKTCKVEQFYNIKR